MTESQGFIKHREIAFQGPHSEQNQAQRAILLLSDVQGVDQVHLLGVNRLSVSYDVRVFTLTDIENALTEVGFHLDNGLMCKLKRALYEYTEVTLRANLGLEQHACQGQCAQKVFVEKYRSKRHGNRDERPAMYRDYL